MGQWDYKIDQPMPGPFPFPNSRKGPGIEVVLIYIYFTYKHKTYGKNKVHTGITRDLCCKQLKLNAAYVYCTIILILK